VASDAETRAKTLRVEQACAKWLADVLKRRGGAEIVSHQEDRWDSFAFGDDLPPIYDMQIARERPIVLNDYGSQFHRGKGDLHPVLFEGKLTVTDPHQLALLLRQGVGPGKAFGCGLLSLARA
jgi:CRISPR-associated protein Cas6/Cse3/CasE subtype I-E